MYVKRATVKRGESSYVYLRLVEAYRQDGKVRHRVIANLGREDELKASGQLDQLAASFARLDPPPWGTRRDVGSLLLVRHYLQRLGLVKLVDDAIPQRGRTQLTHGEVVAALVANRLSAPAPLYDVAGWASSAAVHELLDTPAALLGDDRLGRALEAFAPVAETVRGAMILAAIDTFGADAARLHLDLTTLTVSGHYSGSDLVAKGWNSSRQVQRQVRILAASNNTGVPLYTRPHPGNACPPMGLRVRLKAGVRISGLPYQARVVACALKRYGMILADNGSPWFISGTPDSRWNNDALHLLGELPGRDFEAVDTTSLPHPGL